MHEMVSLNVVSFLQSYHAIMAESDKMAKTDVAESPEYTAFVGTVDDAFSPVFSWLQYIGYRNTDVVVPAALAPYLRLIQQFEGSILGKKFISFEITNAEGERA